MTVTVLAYDTAHPGDTADLAAKLAPFATERIRKLALLVKTEGNADVNDYSREYGLLSTTLALEAKGGPALVARSTFLFSTGCEGAMTPFGYVFIDQADEGAPAARGGHALAMGCARSRSLLPHEIGRMPHAEIAAATVEAAMRDAGVTRDEVALAIVKTPVQSFQKTTVPVDQGRRVTSGHAKAVGALGAGVALGEIERGRLVESDFDADHALHARRAMVFSGAELDCVEVLLLANKQGAAGDLTIHTGFMTDMLDGGAIRRTLAEAGCRLEDGVVVDPAAVVAMLLKVGISPDGRLRGRRTTIRSSHIDMDKHVRAAVSGIVGSILGSTRSFISANTVHQAPPGGGICACVVAQRAE
jgi:cyanuric acid amidohydrolase